MIRNATKDATPKPGSGLVHLMTALHQNATKIINSNSQLNGPDQILPAEEFSSTRRNGCVKLRKVEHGLGSEEPISVPTLLQNIAENYPDVVAFKIKRDEEWISWTYEQYLKEVNTVAKSFIHLGLHRHHSVAILGNNSPEWIVSDVAAIFSGGIAVGLNKWLSPDEIAKICIDCKADVIVVQNEAFLKKILLIQHKLPELRTIIQIDGDPPLSDKRRLHRTHKKIILSWEEMIVLGHNLTDDRLRDRLKKTNETPKGVMISHDNLTWCAKTSMGLIRAPGFNRMPAPGEEILISVLPLSSISAQIIDIYYTLCVVGTLCISSNKNLLTQGDAFFDTVFDVQPTVLFAPTLIYERIFHKLRNLKRSMSGIQKIVLDWSSCTLRDKHLNEQKKIKATRKLNQWQTALAKNTVTKKYKEMLGFTSRTVFFSRGAPMAREVLRFLSGYDIVVHETFGQTENCGLLTANIPKRYCKIGSTGRPGLDAETGEIVCTGRNMFMGYLNKEMETREVIPSEEQCLRLGDLGFIDLDGFTVVIGKQDTFITLASGQVLSPLRIEQLIRLELPCVSQALVIGENQDHLTTLLTLDTIITEETGVPSSDLTEESQKWFRVFVMSFRLVLIGILHNQFTYQNGEIGLNGRLKRPVIIERHKSCIQAMYGNNQDEIGHCSGANASDEAVQVAVHSHSLTQIKEEDETKNCSSSVSNSDNDKKDVKVAEKIEQEEQEEQEFNEKESSKDSSTTENFEENYTEKDEKETNQDNVTEEHTTTVIIEKQSSSVPDKIAIDSSSEVNNESLAVDMDETETEEEDEKDLSNNEETSRKSSTVSMHNKEHLKLSKNIINTGPTLSPAHEKISRT
ncbi:ACSBG [Lepeophtheirus salmonis]|uniref:long-chain-fatty-acid--CoA ligase n=1 Tax=Lepeophtheirus salmonis TaxID=72036 RepID=A0A7R8CRE4_LEPSM|nr:ACSBG [Lepeophtheirus salmonis]CAF2869902.1 ACSBG [Lepeophtheirus salmonis]